MILRDYQRTAVEQVREDFFAGLNPILCSPTGSGKTVMAREIVQRIGKRCVWTVHRRELEEQAAEHLKGIPDVEVISIQKIARRGLPACDYVVIDECFPAGTVVDGRPIETIVIGDVVTNSSGRHRVTGLFRSVPSALVRVITKTRSVVCTPSHPFFTSRGWIPADELLRDDVVYSIIQHHEDQNPASPSVHALSKNRDGGNQERTGSRETGTSLLLGHLQNRGAPKAVIGDDGADEPCSRFRSNENKEPDASTRDPREGQNNAAGDAVGSDYSWWQRTRADHTRNAARLRSGMGDERCGSDEDEARIGLPDLLQNRRREFTSEDWRRSGWIFAQRDGSPIARSKEGVVFELDRVDRVEILKPTSDGTFGGMCPDGLVYNLEVEDDHSYTANGFLVHNCHHAAAASYRACMGVPRVGLSATPARLDGKPLCDLFGRIVIAAETDDLIRDGFLVMPRMFAGEAPDLHGIKKTAGDYNIGALGRCVNKPVLVGDAVQHWMRHANGYRTIAFAVDIAHSKSIVEAFVAAGVIAEHVDGSTPKDERKAILERLRSGATTLVSNVGIATEGFDLPALECVILLRPTESLVLQIQMFGRAMRPCEGKRTPVILDHAGNWHRHHYRGDNRYEWSLDGRVKKANVPANLGLKRCDECYALVGNSLDVCPHCGSEFKVEKRRLSIIDGELVEVGRSAPSNRVIRWIQLLDIAHNNRRCKAWAVERYRVEFGMWPRPTTIAGEAFEETYTASQELQIWTYKHLMHHAKMCPESLRYSSAKTNRAWAAGRYEEIFRRWPTKEVIASVPIDLTVDLFDLVLKEQKA